VQQQEFEKQKSEQDKLIAEKVRSKIKNETRKFIVPFQGGFDGAKPNLKKYSGANISAANTFGFNCTSSTSTGTAAYNKAFSLLSNTDYYDMNLLVTPGIIDSLHPSVTSAARSLATNRQDTFYVMDSNPLEASITAVVNQITTLDSNYSAVYWPWLQIPSRSPNKPIWVPPSVMIPGVLSFNDANGAPWYAPAGLNRGSMETVSDTYKHLTQNDRDTLYLARVNPIANFVNEGVVVFGQKTLQARPSALDRINVRRLLIEVKKFIASSTKYLVFEQNTSATRNKFLNIVNPYMEQIKARQGLYAFRVIMDGTNNTADLIDQNIMYGQIFMQPTRTAEFIILDFNIQPTGAAFPE
jgi:phage tail sheath protein FI